MTNPDILPASRYDGQILDTRITLRVNGVPAPQGSKTYMPATKSMVEGTSPAGRQKLRAWRADVKEAAEKWREENGEPPLIDVPVHLSILFHMPRPKARKRDIYVSTKPDLSKLLRCTEDALTGLIIKDDSYIASVTAAKVYVTDVHPIPGAGIVIFDLMGDLRESFGFPRGTDIAPRPPEANGEPPKGHGGDRSDLCPGCSAATTSTVRPATPTAKPA